LVTVFPYGQIPRLLSLSIPDFYRSA
jgi:hypothetical protein